MKEKGEVERKNREKKWLEEGTKKKKKIEREKCWVRFGEEEREKKERERKD